MADEVKVNPTPIQRNANDVAFELTQLHVSRIPGDIDNIDELFAKYYAIAATLNGTHPKFLNNLVPEEILSKISR
jgi:hypothetical protein